MPASDYLPKSDNDRIVWYNNFTAKFASYAGTLGFVAADVTAVNTDSATFAYLVNAAQQYKDEYAERIAYKKIMADGKLGVATPAAPIAPTIAPPTPIAPPAIIARTRVLVARIKTSPGYSAAIGRDLGVIGTGEPAPIIIKPSITVTSPMGVNVATVKFAKGRFDGVSLEWNRGVGGAFVVVAIALTSPFEHNFGFTTNGVPEVLTYRARFVKGNVTVGDYSDVVSVLVG